MINRQRHSNNNFLKKIGTQFNLKHDLKVIVRKGTNIKNTVLLKSSSFEIYVMILISS